jgi:hypothetical protein
VNPVINIPISYSGCFGKGIRKDGGFGYENMALTSYLSSCQDNELSTDRRDLNTPEIRYENKNTH